MNFLRGHNGELAALVLAGACAWAIAATVFRFEPGAPEAIHVPAIAAAAAIISTWVLWRLIAAYGRRLVVLRAAIAGGLSGALAHPVFMFLLLLRDSAADCAGAACISISVLSPDGLGAAAVGTTIFSVMGLAIFGPLTIPVGMLGGVLAVLIAGGRSNRSDVAPESPDVAVRDDI